MIKLIKYLVELHEPMIFNNPHHHGRGARLLSCQNNMKQHKNANYFILSLFTTLFFHSATAQPLYVMTLSAGPVWAKANHTQTFYLQPDIQKTYVADSSIHTLANGELFLGLQRRINAHVDGQLGLAVLATSVVKPSGNIWDDGYAEFNNYDYVYKINHVHVAAKSKLLLSQRRIEPYLSASIGVGSNRAHGYENIPTIFAAYPEPNFSSHSTTVFVYTLGIGLKYAIKSNLQAGVGYEFANLGSSKLGRGPGQTLGGGLSLHALSTNGVMFNVTYFRGGL